jgi:hypothetical protein
VNLVFGNGVPSESKVVILETMSVVWYVIGERSGTFPTGVATDLSRRPARVDSAVRSTGTGLHGRHP